MNLIYCIFKLFLILFQISKKVELKCYTSSRSIFTTTIMETPLMTTNIMTTSIPFTTTLLLMTTTLKTKSSFSTLLTSTYPLATLNCQIENNTIGINHSRQNHPQEIVQLNDITGCCEFCKKSIQNALFLFTVIIFNNVTHSM